MKDGYTYLLFAILFGTLGNVMAKESRGFTKPLKSFSCLAAMCFTALLYSKILETLPSGVTFITYSVLVGLFTVLFGIHHYNETFDRHTLFGATMILIGTVMLYYKR